MFSEYGVTIIKFSVFFKKHFFGFNSAWLFILFYCLSGTLNNSTIISNSNTFYILFSDACGGVFNITGDKKNGTITSPSFPDLYPFNKNCVWEIVAENQHKITLNFTHFDLEG